MRRLLGVIVIGVMLLVSGVASATVGYVCYHRRNPATGAGSSNWGSAGYVYVAYYTAPGCAGSFQAARYFCSAGATWTACASGTGFTYAREDLNMLASIMQTASISGTKVDYFDVGCNGGAGNCGGTFYVYGTP